MTSAISVMPSPEISTERADDSVKQPAQEAAVPFKDVLQSASRDDQGAQQSQQSQQSAQDKTSDAGSENQASPTSQTAASAKGAPTSIPSKESAGSGKQVSRNNDAKSETKSDDTSTVTQSQMMAQLPVQKVGAELPSDQTVQQPSITDQTIGNVVDPAAQSVGTAVDDAVPQGAAVTAQAADGKEAAALPVAGQMDAVLAAQKGAKQQSSALSDQNSLESDTPAVDDANTGKSDSGLTSGLLAGALHKLGGSNTASPADKAGHYKGASTQEGQNTATTDSGAQTAAASTGLRVDEAVAALQSTSGAKSALESVSSTPKSTIGSTGTDGATAALNSTDTSASSAANSLSFATIAQQASSQPAAKASATSADLPTRVIDQVVQQVQLQRFPDHNDLVVRLSPPELGALRVQITQDASGLTSQIHATNEQVRGLLQAHVPALMEAFSDAGIRVDSVSVSLDSTQTAMSGNAFQQQAQNQGSNSGPQQRTLGQTGSAVQPMMAAGAGTASSSQMGYSWLA